MLSAGKTTRGGLQGRQVRACLTEEGTSDPMPKQYKGLILRQVGMVFQGKGKAWRWEPASLRNEKAPGRLRGDCEVRDQAGASSCQPGKPQRVFRILF